MNTKKDYEDEVIFIDTETLTGEEILEDDLYKGEDEEDE